MHATCQGCTRPDVARLVALLGAWPLAGCAEGSGGTGAWFFIGLSLLLVGALAYWVGSLRERVVGARAVEQARAEAEREQHLERDRRSQRDGALQSLLDALPGATALAFEQDDGRWAVEYANTPARQAWPLTGTAASLEAVAERWPAAVAQALEAAGRGAAASAPPDGWRITPFGPLATGRRGLILSHEDASPARAATADAPSTTASAESDNFSFTVSHDLRAPIRVVEGFTRIVKEDYGHLLDRVGNDHLDRVLGAAARMNLMIDALLTLARLNSQPLSRQPVNLSQLASFVIDDLQRASPEREVEVDIQPGLTAQGDPTLLRLVLENLLGNAWKYSARAERCQISLRTVPHAGKTRVFVVRDNGAGFDMRSADRLFGLFQRLHSASDFPGHGVGLASVRRIIHRHGGEIWAESEPGRGAAFFFTLAD